ncbi:MAG: hypothetical protein C4K58_06930 [Flavobacteriaceae bacterium]|nr:MAG: hypothetical protein C4K58_06930 [Flavobacteriaceae bacterium]
MNAYTYIVTLKDKAADKLQAIAKAAGVADLSVDKFSKGLSNTETRANRLKGVLGGMKGAIAAAFTGVAAAAIFSVGSNIVSVTAEMQKFEAVLTNTFQSAEKGKKAIGFITNFAAKTPFQVDELTDSYVKLVNRGFSPTYSEMTKLGDLASSTGKGFGQLTEAILDAGTGEFERLKEFGVTAHKSGDKIKFSFKGVTTTVQDSEASIRNYILSLGDLKGVQGTAAIVANTLGGRLSNLKDSWTQLAAKIGSASSGILYSAIATLSGAVSWAVENFDLISYKVQAFFSMFSPLVEALKVFAIALFGTGDAGSAVSTVMGILTTALQVGISVFTGIITAVTPFVPLLKAVAMGIGAVMLVTFAIANPFTVLIGLAGLAYVKFDTFRGGVHALWTALKGFASVGINYVVGQVKELIQAVGDAINMFKALGSGDFSKAMDFGGMAIKHTSGVDGKLKAAKIKNIDLSDVGFLSGSDLLGRPFFMELTLSYKGKDYKLPNEPLVRVTARKNIVTTPLLGSGHVGTVKEMVSQDDFGVEIFGLCMDLEDPTRYPTEQVNTIIEACALNVALEVKNPILALCGIHSLVVQAYEIDEMQGKQGSQAYRIMSLSDFDFYATETLKDL